MGRHAGDAARKDLSALGDELLQEVGILPVNGIERDVDAAARHCAIRAAEVGAALRSLWLAHDSIFTRSKRGLLDLPVQRPAAEIRVVLNFLQPVRRVGTLLVARRNVTGWRFALRARFGA